MAGIVTQFCASQLCPHIIAAVATGSRMRLFVRSAYAATSSDTNTIEKPQMLKPRCPSHGVTRGPIQPAATAASDRLISTRLVPSTPDTPTSARSTGM